MMRRISLWGAENPIASRWIIAVCHISIGLLLLFLGVLLYQLEWQAARWMYLIPAHLFLLAFVLYPEKRFTKGIFKFSYRRQKVNDFTLVILAGFAIAISTNYFLHHAFEFDEASKNTPVRLTAYHPEAHFAPAETEKAPDQIFKKQRKQLKAKFKEFRKTLKANKTRRSNGTMILLTVLTIALAIVLAYVIAAIACSLSCSGLEALAIIVLLVGATGIIWGSIVLIKRIWGRGERKLKPKKDLT